MTPRLARSTAVVAGMTILTKMSGVVRTVIIASYFGTSGEMDAFIVALTILGLALAWLEKPIGVVVIPLVTRAVVEHGKAAAWQSASRLMNGAFMAFAAVAIVEAALAPIIVAVIAPGLESDVAGLAGRMAQLLAVVLILTGLNHFLSAVNQAYGHFARPGAATVSGNLVSVLAIAVLAPIVGIWSLAGAMALGALVGVVAQMPVVWTYRHHYRPRLDLADPALRRMAWLGAPLMIGTAGAHLGHLTDRFFASLLPAGRLSALSYAHQLTYVPLNVLVTSLVTVLFPYLSRRAGAADYEDLSRKLGRAVRMLFVVVLPVAVVIGVLHEPLVRLVYERGAFTAESTRITGETVLFYALGLPASAVSLVLSYGFYSVEDTKTPMMAGLVRLAVKLLLSLALVGSLAHVGLALAESLSLCVKTLLLVVLLPAKLRSEEYRRVMRSFVVTSGIGAAMALVLLTVMSSMDGLLVSGASTPATVGVVAVAAAIGGASYLALSLLFQPVEVRDLYRVVRSGLARRA